MLPHQARGRGDKARALALARRESQSLAEQACLPLASACFFFLERGVRPSIGTSLPATFARAALALPDSKLQHSDTYGRLSDRRKGSPRGHGEGERGGCKGRVVNPLHLSPFPPRLLFLRPAFASSSFSFGDSFHSSLFSLLLSFLLRGQPATRENARERKRVRSGGVGGGTEKSCRVTLCAPFSLLLLSPLFFPHPLSPLPALPPPPKLETVQDRPLPAHAPARLDPVRLLAPPGKSEAPRPASRVLRRRGLRRVPQARHVRLGCRLPARARRLRVLAAPGALPHAAVH